jgi:hypothetical protein
MPTRMLTFSVAAICSSLLFVGASASLKAQPLSPGQTVTQFSLTGVNQFRTGMQQGGDFDWYEADARLRVMRQFTPELMAGFSVTYGYQHWNWSSPTAFGGQAPWGNVQTPGLGLSFAYMPTQSLRLSINPSIQWAGEVGVGTAGSAIYGAVLSATNTFSPDLTLGLGAAVFRELGQTKVYPFLAIRWKITDQLTLANPLPAGPAGGAGLELSYAVDSHWTVGAGGAYRNYRFRLNNSGPYAGGIGQNRVIPVFARVSYAFTRATSLDFYAIASTGGSLRAESADGSVVSSTSYNTGVGLAVNFSHRF